MSSARSSTSATFNDVFPAQRGLYRDMRAPAKLGLPGGEAQVLDGEGIGLLRLLIVRSLTCAAKGGRFAPAFLVIFAGHACVQAVTSPQLSDDGDFLTAFVVDDYLVIGRQRDDGPPYVGAAGIPRAATELVLSRSFDGREAVARGCFDVASAGEGRVVRCGWEENGLEEMTCQVHSDVDNHARITRYGHSAGEVGAEPGLEALLSTAT